MRVQSVQVCQPRSKQLGQCADCFECCAPLFVCLYPTLIHKLNTLKK